MEYILVLLVLLAAVTGGGGCKAGEYAVDEQFDDLDDWTPVTFPDIEEHTQYAVISSGNEHVLVARSNASASGIRYAKEFNVYSFPIVRWRWKIENVYARGNVTEKNGDDYPLRVYIIFKYDPETASLATQIKYGAMKMLYGTYPPDSSLNYIWANRNHEKQIYPSTYTGRARMMVLRAGEELAGTWVEEERNIIEDYRQAFGEKPPATASIAIMNDSDNTGEAAVSYLDYIQVRGTDETDGH